MRKKLHWVFATLFYAFSAIFRCTVTQFYQNAVKKFFLQKNREPNWFMPAFLLIPASQSRLHSLMPIYDCSDTGKQLNYLILENRNNKNLLVQKSVRVECQK